jgi:hypothetical protein
MYGRYNHPKIANEDGLRDVSDYFERNQVIIIPVDFVRVWASAKCCYFFLFGFIVCSSE